MRSEAAKEVNLDIKLVPTVIKDTASINAKDYVYLGSCETQFVLDMGVTLDAEGALLNKSELVTTAPLADRLLCDPDAVRHA